MIVNLLRRRATEINPMKPSMAIARAENIIAYLIRKQFPVTNSVQTRCIVKGEAQKSPLFWRFSGGY